MKKEKSVKENVKKAGGILLFWGVCILLGILIGFAIKKLSGGSVDKGQVLLKMMLVFVSIFVGTYLHILIHEAGHLLFGLLTGYRFSSFRIGSFMLKKEGEKLRLCRFSLAGTGGQCLMAPPPWREEGFPFVWYNMGGFLMNFFVAAIFGILAVMFRSNSSVLTVCITVALMGVFIGLMNGIPIHTETVDNDGSNIREISKNMKARKAFWLQLRVNEEIAKGVMLKNMPEEWFWLPEDADMQNGIVASQAVLYCNRLMDAGELEAAYEAMTALLKKSTAVLGIHRAILSLDCAFCEMLGENRKDVVESFLNEETKNVMKAMKQFPGVLRTQYAYQLLVEGDTEKAQATKATFERMSKTYPNPNELVGEWEFLDKAKAKWEGLCEASPVEQTQENG